MSKTSQTEKLRTTSKTANQDIISTITVYGLQDHQSRPDLGLMQTHTQRVLEPAHCRTLVLGLSPHRYTLINCFDIVTPQLPLLLLRDIKTDLVCHVYQGWQYWCPRIVYQGVKILVPTNCVPGVAILVLR